MKSTPQHVRDRAEAAFKKKEAQAREGEKAMAEYQEQNRAIRDRTARLRALRLAREAAKAGESSSASARR